MELPIKIELKEPIQFGSETISELVIPRAMVAGDISDIPVMTIETITTGQVLSVIGRMANQPKAVMDMVSPKDLRPIVEVFSSFF